MAVSLLQMADQVPHGHVPRSITIKAEGSTTRCCDPGDVVEISGVFLPTPYTGFNAIRAGLLSDTYIHAMKIERTKKSYADEDPSEDVLMDIDELSGEQNMYEVLANR